MELQKGKFYSNSRADIFVEIVKIHHKTDEYTKATTRIFAKSDKRLMEDRKKYKLVHEYISDWEEYNAKV